ncbi:hypothetical protein JTE90_005674 [Oedothorax gibbosus]|uniref:HTH CENPB-type domain-containing protein n=1 Tax=Oedothorax gibbosus TaxID=931172 RepID=A0AAV6UIT1_9ARAC|nr:hypothetical protein JTE90_005674 [Oedothorax gibbosus]
MEKRKRKHVTITLAEKLKVLERVDNGESHSKIAKEIGVGHTTIYDWIKNRNHLESLVICGDVTALKSRRTLKKPKCERLDNALWLWFVQERRKGTEVSGPMIKEKAISLYEELGYGQDSFLASDGWLQNWKKRHDVANINKWIHAADSSMESTYSSLPETTNTIKIEETETTDTIRSQLCEVVYNNSSQSTTDTISSEHEDSSILITSDSTIKDEFNDYSTKTNNSLKSEYRGPNSFQTENNFIQTGESCSHVFHSEIEQDSFPKASNPRSSLTLDEKLNILRRIGNGESVTRVSREMRIGQTTIYDWIKNRKKIENHMKCVNLTEQRTRKTLTRPKFEALEKALWLWFVQERKKGIEVSGTMLKEKALVLQRKIYGDQDKDQFLASNGWLQNWKKRHNLTNCEGWIQIHTAEYTSELTDDQIVASVSQTSEDDGYEECKRTQLYEAVYEELNQTSQDAISSKGYEESNQTTKDVIQSDDECDKPIQITPDNIIIDQHDEPVRNTNIIKNNLHEYDEHIQITSDIITIDQHDEPTRTNTDIIKNNDEYGNSKQASNDVITGGKEYKEHIQITPDIITRHDYMEGDQTTNSIVEKKDNECNDSTQNTNYIMRTKEEKYDENIQIIPDIIMSDEHENPTSTDVIENNNEYNDQFTDDILRTGEYHDHRTPISHSEAILALDTLFQYIQESSHSTPMDFDFVNKWRFIAATKQD